MSPKGSPGKLRKGGEWTNVMLAVVLGTNAKTLGHYLNGERYPEVRMMLRFERLFHWDIAEQVKLVPLVGYDLRYSMVLRMVVEDWKHNNPRTQRRQELKSLFPEATRGRYSRGQEERHGGVTKITSDSE